jgi:8-oxo-dGTP diphosphatase
MRSFLVRHGEAGYRQAWTQPDELRPLTTEGRRHAEALVEVLAGEVVTRFFSSPYVRCVQSLEPLAAARHLHIELTDRLAEGAGGDGALALASGEAGGGAVLCSHGDVIEAALDILADAGVPLKGRSGETPKGTTWTFEVRKGRIVEGELVALP